MGTSCFRGNGNNGPRHSAIGDVTPADKLAGREEIWSELYDRGRGGESFVDPGATNHGPPSDKTQPPSRPTETECCQEPLGPARSAAAPCSARPLGNSRHKKRPCGRCASLVPSNRGKW